MMPLDQDKKSGSTNSFLS